MNEMSTNNPIYLLIISMDAIFIILLSSSMNLSAETLFIFYMIIILISTLLFYIIYKFIEKQKAKNEGG